MGLVAGLPKGVVGPDTNGPTLGLSGFANGDTVGEPTAVELGDPADPVGLSGFGSEFGPPGTKAGDPAMGLALVLEGPLSTVGVRPAPGLP